MSNEQSQRSAAFFVGDHLALDFVNSRSRPSGVWTEWLADGADLLDWLQQASAIDAAVAGRFRAGDARRLDEIAGQARDLRAWLRSFVEAHAGRPLEADVVAELAPLNRLLAEDRDYLQVDVADAGSTQEPRLVQRRLRRWTSPRQLLLPIAEAIADLVCHADFRLIRACEGSACTILFLDRTKAHARRWCSMAICGNRAKVAAYRARALTTCARIASRSSAPAGPKRA
jgi:predicted RNA-binding Zn ribbon-like protein